MARRARFPHEREMLLDMARTWDDLASHRAEQIARQKRIADVLATIQWQRANTAMAAHGAEAANKSSERGEIVDRSIKVVWRRLKSSPWTPQR